MEQPSKRPETLAEWALWYASNGWRVFPLLPKTKSPLKDSSGFKDATTDLAQVRAWWTANPDYNIGYLPIGTVVIDYDEHPNHDQSGLRTLHEWEQEHGELPETLTSITGSGGQHVFYTTSKVFYKSEDKDGDRALSIDIRATNGYVLLPPSVHPNGNAYEWQDWPWDMEPAEADANTISFIEYVQEHSTGAKKGDSATGEHVSFELPDVIREHTRHSILKSYAASLRGKGYHDDVVRACLNQANLDRCEPRLPQKEVDSIIEYFCNMGAGHDGKGEFMGEGLAIPSKLQCETLYSHDINDKALGRLFAKSYGHLVRYVPSWKSFAVFNGKYWQVEGGTQFAERFIKQFITNVQVFVATEIVDDDERAKAVKLAASYNKQTYRSHLLKDVQSELVTKSELFDADLNLLNVENGTLDLTTMQLMPHDPADMLTKMANVTYDPNAPCDGWLTFLAEVLEGDFDTIRYLQQQLGVSLAGDTTQEHMHVLFGPTRSGKSTTLKVVQTLMGGYACGVSPSTITKQKRNGQNASSDLARLDGVRFAVIPEPQQGMELSAETVKMLTGNDVVTARHLYQGEKDFSPCVNLWVATNHMPQIDDPTVLESDRIVIVPFDRHLEMHERDKGLKDRLCRAESLSGVLNWLLAGLADYRNGAAPVPSNVQELGNEFLEQADRVAVFVSEVLVKDGESYMTARACYDLYIEWAEAGNADVNKGKQSFFADLRRLGILKDRWRKLKNVVAGYRAPEREAAA